MSKRSAVELQQTAAVAEKLAQNWRNNFKVCRINFIPYAAAYQRPAVLLVLAIEIILHVHLRAYTVKS